jgi:hypothetical protein
MLGRNKVASYQGLTEEGEVRGELGRLPQLAPMWLRHCILDVKNNQKAALFNHEMLRNVIFW